MKEFEVTLWVDGFDGEIWTTVEAKDEDDAINKATEQFEFAGVDVNEVWEA